MIRLIVAVAVGLVIAVGATALAQTVLTSQVNGTQTTQTLYNYGSR